MFRVCTSMSECNDMLEMHKHFQLARVVFGIALILSTKYYMHSTTPTVVITS